MKSLTHSRPPAWTNRDALNLPISDYDDLENLLHQIARGGLLGCTNKFSQLRFAIHQQLESGSGAIWFESEVLSGLDWGNFNRTFEQFCMFLGSPVPINSHGKIFKKVEDEGIRDSVFNPVRGHMTNQELAYHSDRADITILACWQQAAYGGEFKIFSSSKLVELINSRNYSWRHLLNQPIPHDLRDEAEGYCHIPILVDVQDNFVLRYIRKFNESVVRHGIELDAEVSKMLDDIDLILNESGASVELEFKKGAFSIVNNHITLHSRNKFMDIEDRRRCLLRCWISSEFTRPLPIEFLPIFHEIRPGVIRGGVKHRNHY
jgi:hypothetical protein